MTTNAPPARTTAERRLQSVDLLRGAVMVIMAIDHIRDMMHAGSQHLSPEDLSQASAALFLTRWITHFCAPTFVFLAGTSAWLSGRRRTPAQLSQFLLTRGLWLLVVEMTLILFGETFNLSYQYVIWQVMWAIGWSMIALAALIHLPWRALLVFSIVMIAGHNALDGVSPETFGSLGWLWGLLHVGFTILPLSSSHTLVAVYPLIPWIGVMSAGYCFGRVMTLDAPVRRRLLWQIGGALTIAFVLVRGLDGYGDPAPWDHERTPLFTVLAFLRTSKYPPSLDYLLMTLGPALLALAALDGVSVSPRNPFLVFGRVPFLYYVVHWYVLHGVAVVLAWMRYGRFDFLFGIPPSTGPFSVGYPADYGYTLGQIYLIWIAIVIALYPLCAWFAGVKSRSRAAWLSYL